MIFFRALLVMFLLGCQSESPDLKVAEGPTEFSTNEAAVLFSFPTQEHAMRNDAVATRLTPTSKPASPLYGRYTRFSGVGLGWVEFQSEELPECRVSARGDLFFTGQWKEAKDHRYPLNRERLTDMAFLATKATMLNLQCRLDHRIFLDVDLAPRLFQSLERRSSESSRSYSSPSGNRAFPSARKPSAGPSK